MPVTVVQHPLLQRNLSIIRDKKSSNDIFRNALSQIAELMAVEVSQSFELTKYSFETPLEKTTGYKLKHEYVLVPVIRAGLGLLDGFLKFIPMASVSHIGVSRDHETHLPKYYYSNIPTNVRKAVILILDPMLATGGSAIMAIDLLKEKGGKNISLVSVVAAPEGVKAVEQAHPDVKIYTAALDRKLNANKYILPGLGDAGDRIYGT
jgi:uracil phosphoribosyltransferase